MSSFGFTSRGRRSAGMRVMMRLTAAAPILLYGWWASVPGTHPTPFEWDMTGPAWILWLGLPRLARMPDEMALTFAFAIAAVAAALIYAAMTAQHTIFGTPGL